MRAFESDPFKAFETALKHAESKNIPEANAMSLATADQVGSPSVRVVYYKGTVRGGLSFYTNYLGKKGQDLSINPKAAANFFWPELFEQARFQGLIEKMSFKESEAYFHSRPRISQIGAWASNQSEEIPDHETLLSRFDEYEKKFEGLQVPCPPHWGGYLLLPLEIEFWIGRDGRLHERYVYQRLSLESPWRTFMRSP